MLLMEEILHHLGCIKPRKITVDFNYLPFPQLVDPRRISSRCSSTRTNPTNRRAAASPRIITAVLCAGVSLSFALRIASKAGWPVACGLGRRWLTACAKKINGWNPKIMEVDGRWVSFQLGDIFRIHDKFQGCICICIYIYMYVCIYVFESIKIEDAVKMGKPQNNSTQLEDPQPFWPAFFAQFFRISISAISSFQNPTVVPSFR